MNYGVTPSIDAPGNSSRQGVLVEWTDTNITNATFEGSARELLRLDMRDRIHPIGDIIFNPTAGPDDDDWRVMYLSVGDAGNGEQGNTAVRNTPQLLSTLGGKILRIVPDNDGVNLAVTIGPNGKYYIPDDNPYTGLADSNVRDEIWALGLRNPHRMAWDVDPANPNLQTNNRLIVNDIGLHTWEEVNFLRKGGNYG
jgi:glucose/arabinose dehydrogenase